MSDRKPNIKEKRPASVVVTGASSGIGRATALLLDRQGYRVFAGVRRSSDADALREVASDRLSPLILDVTDAKGIADAARFVEIEVGEMGLRGLVNNAGVVVNGVLEFLDIDQFRYQLEVNLIGTLAVTQAFLASIRKAKGRIVNISSDAGVLASPFMGPYSASKFGLEGLSDSLRRELRPFGVQVVTIGPGAIETPIWGKGRSDADEYLDALPPEAERLYGEKFRKFQAFLDKSGDAASPPRRWPRPSTTHFPPDDRRCEWRWEAARSSTGGSPDSSRFASWTR